MEIVAILLCVLIIVHIFCTILTGLLSVKDISIDYLFSSRDKEITSSLYFDRAKRSFYNLFETLPLFIILFFLSIIKPVENTELAFLWVFIRFVYIPVYIFNLKYLRTIIWITSFIILILMGVKFI